MIFYQIIMGLCPKPRDLTLYRQKHGEKGQCKKTLPHVFVTSCGARVASQQEPYPPSDWIDSINKMRFYQ